MVHSQFDKLLLEHRTIICVGSGGVGKTTISAALGIRAAQLGLQALVMTIDPSKRLKVALGVVGENKENVLVPGQKYAGKLFATILNAEELFKSFILQAATNQEFAQGLLKNKLYKQLSTTLSGSQEFTALLQLLKMVEDRSYDLVILDTPPAQHAVEFLEAPQKITALFQDNIVRWFVGEDKREGLIRKILSRGTHALFLALEKVTGSGFMRELNDFFINIRHVQAKIGERAEQIQLILRDQKTIFLLVTGFDAAKLREAESLQQYLITSGYGLGGVIINRAFPQWSQDMATPLEIDLAREYVRWHKYHEQREQVYRQCAEQWGQKLPVVRMPDLHQDINGLTGLEGISDELGKAFSRLQ